MRRVFSLSVVISFLLIALLVAGSTSPAFANNAPKPRVTQAIDESRMVTMAGNVRPEAKNVLNDRGPVSDTLDIDHIFLLLQRSPKQEKALDRLIEELNDRNSPNFHQWLTPEQYGEYGVSQADIQKVTDWLESHGFRVNQVYTNHMLIDFSGTAGQLRSVFRTDIHHLDVDGEQHIANVNDPMIPAALMPVVHSIVSLNDFKPHPTYKTKADYTFAGCTSNASSPTGPGSCYAVTPSDDAVIYNLNPLFAAGYSGQGQTVAIAEDTDSFGTDFATYRSTFGLSTAYPSGNLTTTHPGSCSDPGTNADDGEADLDVEVATTFAPSATINLISCPSGTVTFGGQIALQNMINAGGATASTSVVSVSYGVCEAFNGAGGNKMFYNTYQQAASEGYSVFVSSGDAGASQCSGNFGLDYSLASLGVTGWGESPYNVSVGGTDFEDVYNAKTGQNGGLPLSAYWSATNSGSYGSAQSYIPEIPWNDSCGSTLISEFIQGNFQTYGSGHLCNTAPYNTTTSYISLGAAGAGASNCATGAAGSNQTDYGVITSECQGLPKPSFQTGAALSGGQAVYGSNTDGLRDIPDVSLFASNGVFGHFQTVCWADTAYTSDGAAVCTGAPSTWSGFGGTSVATPAMAGIQALINQKTGTNWGNPLTQYYQIGQNQYGTAGGTFYGASCNSSTGNTGGCAFNDVTQGDIDYACENNGTIEEAHCYPGGLTVSYNTGIYGVESTDNVTSATVLWGGTGYISAPTCTIAGPTNNNPYLSPLGATLYAGGTQATCTASVSTATTTAVWTFAAASASAAGYQIILTNVPFGGSTTCGPYTLTGTSTTAIATNLVTAIGSGCTLLSGTPTRSSSTVTMTAKSPGGAANNFIVQGTTNSIFASAYYILTNTTKGQGPNYVSGITVTAAGRGYQPDTPITLTGVGSGATAVANTSPNTPAQSYQPAYGAAPGYDMATGLGTPNAYYLVNNCVWTNNCPQRQTITVTTAPPSSAAYNSSFGVAATASSGLTVAFTASGVCSVVDNGDGTANYTMTSGTGTCTVIMNQAGNSSWYAATQVTRTVNASKATNTVTFTTAPPASAVYGSNFTVAASGLDSNPVTYASSGVCTNSGTPTYTMTSGTGTCTVTASQATDSNYNAGSASAGVSAAKASQTITFTTDAPASAEYGSSFTVAATASSGLAVSFTSAGACSNVGATYTMTASSGTCSVLADQAGNSNYAAAPEVSESTNATNANGGVSVGSSLNPSVYGQSVTFTATITSDTGQVKGRRNGRKPMTVTGSVTWSSNTGCGTTSITSVGSGSGTATCTTSTLAVGTDTVEADYSGDANHNAGSGTVSQVVNSSNGNVTVTSGLNPSAYGQSVTFTATIAGDYGLLKGKKPMDVSGSVTWSVEHGLRYDHGNHWSFGNGDLHHVDPGSGNRHGRRRSTRVTPTTMPAPAR